MKLVSRLSVALAICSLVTVLSFGPLLNPANQKLQANAQVPASDMAFANISGQQAYGPQIPYGPIWPVDDMLQPLGPSVPPDYAQLVLTKAKSLMGLPYLFGGNDPSRALDCSSYVQLVFKEAGLELPRVTYDQFKLGTPVPIDQLKPGDLMFFATDGPGPSHIGIYAGEGQFIHESPPGVQITKVDNPFYLRQFVGAHRILN